MTEIGVKQLSSGASRVIRTVEGGDQVLVTKRGKAATVVLSVDEAEDYLLALDPEFAQRRASPAGLLQRPRRSARRALADPIYEDFYFSRGRSSNVAGRLGRLHYRLGGDWELARLLLVGRPRLLALEPKRTGDILPRSAIGDRGAGKPLRYPLELVDRGTNLLRLPRRVRDRARERNSVRTRVLYPAIARANELLAREDEPRLPDGITFHALRRTYAALRAELGEHPAVTAAQMGHRDPRMTLRVYTDVTGMRPRTRMAGVLGIRSKPGQLQGIRETGATRLELAASGVTGATGKRPQTPRKPHSQAE